jgi:hypothetical protein
MRRVSRSVSYIQIRELQTRTESETPCDRWLGSCNSLFGDLRVEVWKW